MRTPTLIALLAGALLVPANAQTRSIERAYVDADGNAHVVNSGGHDKKIRKEKGQVGSDAIKLAEDGRTVGWMAQYPFCCTSYPIPLVVVVYRDGKIIQRLRGGNRMIYDWRFWSNGAQVAFCAGTVHGDSGGHCELYDTHSGKLLTAIDGHLNEESPEWARGLRN